MTRIAPGMRLVGLIATLALIAALEVKAGDAAGWGSLAYLLPLAIDTFVLGVVLAERSMLADRLFALGLVEFTVVVSAVAGHHDGDANVKLGGVLATALVLTLWRQDETIRRERRAGETPVDHAAALEQAVRDAVARTVAEQAALREQAIRDAVAATAGRTERPAPKPPAEPVATRRPAPSGEQVRAILLALDDMDAVTNAELSRRHGGSDTHWRNGKKALRAELADMTREAGAL